MKWLIGIAIVMGLAHLYFRSGQRRLEQQHKGEREGTTEAADGPPTGEGTEPDER